MRRTRFHSINGIEKNQIWDSQPNDCAKAIGIVKIAASGDTISAGVFIFTS